MPLFHLKSCSSLSLDCSDFKVEAEDLRWTGELGFHALVLQISSVYILLRVAVGAACRRSAQFWTGLEK